MTLITTVDHSHHNFVFAQQDQQTSTTTEAPPPPPPDDYYFQCGVNRDIDLPNARGVIRNLTLAGGKKNSSEICDEIIIGPNVNIGSIFVFGNRHRIDVPFINRFVIDGVTTTRMSLYWMRFVPSTKNNGRLPSFSMKNSKVSAPLDIASSPFYDVTHSTYPHTLSFEPASSRFEDDDDHGPPSRKAVVGTDPNRLSLFEFANNEVVGPEYQPYQSWISFPFTSSFSWFAADVVEVQSNTFRNINTNVVSFTGIDVSSSFSFSSNTITVDDTACQEKYKQMNNKPCPMNPHFYQHIIGVMIDKITGPTTSSSSSSSTTMSSSLLTVSNNKITSTIRSEGTNTLQIRQSGNFSDFSVQSNEITVTTLKLLDGVSDDNNNNQYRDMYPYISLLLVDIYGVATQTVAIEKNRIAATIRQDRKYTVNGILLSTDASNINNYYYNVDEVYLSVLKKTIISNNHIIIINDNGLSSRGILTSGFFFHMKLIEVQHNFIDLNLEDGSFVSPSSNSNNNNNPSPPTPAPPMFPGSIAFTTELIFAAPIMLEWQTDSNATKVLFDEFSSSSSPAATTAVLKLGPEKVVVANNIIINFLFVKSDDDLSDIHGISMFSLSVPLELINYQTLEITNNQIFASGQSLRCSGLRLTVNSISESLLIRNNTFNTNGDSPVVAQKAPLRLISPEFLMYENLVAILFADLGQLAVTIDQQHIAFLDFTFQGAMMKNVVVAQNTFLTSAQSGTKANAICLVRWRPDLNQTLDFVEKKRLTFGYDDGVDRNKNKTAKMHDESLNKIMFHSDVTVRDNVMHVRKPMYHYFTSLGVVDDSVASQMSLFWSSTLARPVSLLNTHDSSFVTIEKNRATFETGQHNLVLFINSTFKSVTIQDNIADCSQTGWAEFVSQYWISLYSKRFTRLIPTRSVLFSSSNSLVQNMDIQRNTFTVSHASSSMKAALFTCGNEIDFASTAADAPGKCLATVKTTITNNNFTLSYSLDSLKRNFSGSVNYDSEMYQHQRRVHLVNATSSSIGAGQHVSIDNNHAQLNIINSNSDSDSTSSSSSSANHMSEPSSSVIFASLLNLVEIGQSKSSLLSTSEFSVHSNTFNCDFHTTMSSATTNSNINSSSSSSTPLIKLSFVTAQVSPLRNHSTSMTTTSSSSPSALSSETDLHSFYQKHTPVINFNSNRLNYYNQSEGSSEDNKYYEDPTNRVIDYSQHEFFRNLQSWCPFNYHHQQSSASSSSVAPVIAAEPLFFRLNVSSPQPACNVMSMFASSSGSARSVPYYAESINLEKIRDHFYFFSKESQRILTFQTPPTTTTTTTTTTRVSSSSSLTNGTSESQEQEFTTTTVSAPPPPTEQPEPFSPFANFIFSSDQDENVCYDQIWEKYKLPEPTTSAPTTTQDLNFKNSSLSAAEEMMRVLSNRRPPAQTPTMIVVNNIVQGMLLVVTSIAAGSLSLPALVFSVSRHQVMVNYVRGAAESGGGDCTGLLPMAFFEGNNILDGVPLADSPIQAIIGDSKVRYLVGQSVFNFVYCLVVFALGQIFVNFVGSYKNDENSNNSSSSNNNNNNTNANTLEQMLQEEEDFNQHQNGEFVAFRLKEPSSSVSLSKIFEKQRDLFSAKHLSLLLFCLFGFFVCPTLSSGLVVAAFKEDSEKLSVGEKALAAGLGILFSLLGVLFVVWSLFLRHPRKEEFKKIKKGSSSSGEKTGLFDKMRKYLFVGEGDWLLKPKKRAPKNNRPQFDEDGNATSFYTAIDLKVDDIVHMKYNIASVCFDSYNNKVSSWFALFEIGVQVALAFAVLIAQLTPLAASCLTQGVILIFIFGLHFLLTVFRRPYRVAFAGIFIPVASFFCIVLVGVALVTSVIEQNKLSSLSTEQLLQHNYNIALDKDKSPLNWMLTVLIVPIIVNIIAVLILIVFALAPVNKWRSKIQKWATLQEAKEKRRAVLENQRSTERENNPPRRRGSSHERDRRRSYSNHHQHHHRSDDNRRRGSSSSHHNQREDKYHDYRDRVARQGSRDRNDDDYYDRSHRRPSSSSTHHNDRYDQTSSMRRQQHQQYQRTGEERRHSGSNSHNNNNINSTRYDDHYHDNRHSASSSSLHISRKPSDRHSSSRGARELSSSSDLRRKESSISQRRHDVNNDRDDRHHHHHDRGPAASGSSRRSPDPAFGSFVHQSSSSFRKSSSSGGVDVRNSNSNRDRRSPSSSLPSSPHHHRPTRSNSDRREGERRSQPRDEERDRRHGSKSSKIFHDI